MNLYAYVGNTPANFIDPLGLDPISELGDALRNICNNPECVDPSNKANCLMDAKNLSNELDNFFSHYNNPAKSGNAEGADPVNGYFCWDWAAGIMGAARVVSQSTFGATYRGFFVPPEQGTTTSLNHWGVNLGVKNNPCPDCSVNLDDGFDRTGKSFGKGQLHLGPWKAPRGWAEADLDRRSPGPPLTAPLQPMP